MSDERIYNSDNPPCWSQEQGYDPLPEDLPETLSGAYKTGYIMGRSQDRVDTRRELDMLISKINAWRARL